MIPDDIKKQIKMTSFDIIWSKFSQDKPEIANMPIKEALKFLDAVPNIPFTKVSEGMEARKREVLPNNYKKMVGSLEQEILTLTEFYYEFGRIPEGAN